MSSKSTLEGESFTSKLKAGEKVKQCNSGATTHRMVAANKSKGNTEDLHGFIYDVGVHNQSELLTTTTKKIANFTCRTCSDSQDFNIALGTLIDPTFNLTTKLTGGDDIFNTLLLTREIDDYIKRKSADQKNKVTIYAVVVGQ